MYYIIACITLLDFNRLYYIVGASVASAALPPLFPFLPSYGGVFHLGMVGVTCVHI